MAAAEEATSEVIRPELGAHAIPDRRARTDNPRPPGRCRASAPLLMDSVLRNARLDPDVLLFNGSPDDFEKKIKDSNPGVFDESGNVVKNVGHFYVNTAEERALYGESMLSHTIDLATGAPQTLDEHSAKAEELTKFAYPMLSELAPHMDGIPREEVQTQIADEKLGLLGEHPNFKGVKNRIHINFLSRGFPEPKDHIFINDARYRSHIKRMPGDA